MVDELGVGVALMLRAVARDGIAVAVPQAGGVMRQILLTTIVPVLLFSSSTAGQQAPDLTGTWVMDVTRSASAASAGHVPSAATAEVLIVRQSAEALVIERRRGTVSEVISYSFNKEDRAAAGGRPSTPPRPQVGQPDRPVGTSGSADLDPLTPRGASDAREIVLGSEVRDAHAEVKNGKIVTRTELSVNGKSVTTDESLSLADGGRELIIERLLKVHHGYEGVQSYKEAVKSDAVGKNVYIRSR